ncbi:hypothetical protein DCAR_0417617 [Daucus carota subsp. sativus]|uniref:Uncharacterized protein n=1 Tax=Daucus carota subsp. sativus TaxID=79200 RepID=A0A165YTA3_DAUCS|nr:hypothetical protein DCAR_0417617 [Daucus carota subsp. sativus]
MPSASDENSVWLCKIITEEEIKDKQLVLCESDMSKYIYAHAPHLEDLIEEKGMMVPVKMKTHKCRGDVSYSFISDGTFLKKEIEDMYVLGWDGVAEMYTPSEGNYIYLKYSTVPAVDEIEVFEFFISEVH